MDHVKLIDHIKNERVRFMLDGKEEIYAIRGFDLTEPAKKRLSNDYEDWQVNHIAKQLKEQMLDAEREKSLETAK